MFIIGIIVFIIILTISIAVHEAGHAFSAKKFGAGVSEYSIGFGPKIWSKVKNGTEYNIKWIFLGGGTRINAMYPPIASKRASKKGWIYNLCQQGRNEAIEDEKRDGKEKSFYRLSTGRKLFVILIAPFTNLFLAVIFIAIAVLGVGFSTPSLTLSSVPKCFDGSSKCKTYTPAYNAGIRTGDTIISVNGKKINDWNEFSGIIQSSKTINITYKHQNETKSAKIIPEKNDNRNVIGVVAGTKMVRDIKLLPKLEVQQIGGTLKLYASLPKMMFDSTKAAILRQPRTGNSLMSIVGVARISGDVGESAGKNGNSILEIISIWLLLGASVNLALWLFNLLPILPMDGGQAVGILWEAIRRLFRKIRGKTTKIYSDLSRLLPLSYFVWILFALMSVVLIWADLFNPIKI